MIRRPPGPVRDRLTEIVARQVARRFAFRVPWEELYDLGLPAMHAAKQAWNGQGSFQPFAIQRIRWRILDELRKRRRDEEMIAAAAAELAARQHVLKEDQLHRSHRPQRDAEANIDEVLDGFGANYALDVEAGDVVPHDSERIRLRKAVEELPPPEDQVIHRYCYLGQTFDEVADHLGIGETTARDIHKRAVQRLLRVFTDPGTAPAPMAG